MLGAFAAISCYAGSSVFQVYWLQAPLSLYGQFLFFLLFMALMTFAMLAALAVFLGDPRVLLPHHRRSGRRLFCCVLCGRLTDVVSSEAVLESAGAVKGLSDGEDGCGSDSSASRGGCRRFAWVALSQTEVLALLGVNNGLAAILQFWATPPTRTPPLIATVVGSLSVVAAIPLSKFALGDRKKYLAPAPIAAVALIGASVFLSLAPAALAGGSLAGSESARDVIIWTIINVVSQVPSAMANIGAQAYLVRGGARLHGVAGRTASLVGVLRFVAYNQVAVAALTLVCFWADVLPYFGSTPDLRALAAGVAYSFACSLLGPAAAGAPPVGLPAGACDARTPLWAVLSIAPYGGYLVGMAVVSQDSGVFSTVVAVVTSTVLAVIWLIPGVNPAAAATPLWAVLPALFLGLAGTALYKRWEMTGEAEGGGLHARGLEPVPDDLYDAAAAADAATNAAVSDNDTFAGSSDELARGLLSRAALTVDDRALFVAGLKSREEFDAT